MQLSCRHAVVISRLGHAPSSGYALRLCIIAHTSSLSASCPWGPMVLRRLPAIHYSQVASTRPLDPGGFLSRSFGWSRWAVRSVVGGPFSGRCGSSCDPDAQEHRQQHIYIHIYMVAVVWRECLCVCLFVCLFGCVCVCVCVANAR